MPIGDLIDLERECSNPECKHKRNTHGGTYYKRDCGVINCVCKEFAEIKYTSENCTFGGLLSEANRLDNANRVWSIRAKQANDANLKLRQQIRELEKQLKDNDNRVVAVDVKLAQTQTDNQVLREELAKCQEVLELMRQAGHLPPMLGNYLLGPDQSAEDYVIPAEILDYEDC